MDIWSFIMGILATLFVEMSVIITILAAWAIKIAKKK